MPQIIQLALGRRLAEVFGVAQERVVALSEESGNQAADQQQKQKRRVKEDHDGERDSGDGLLEEAANGLNHAQAVRSLNARAFQPVIERGVLIRLQIQRRRVPHDFNADVARVAVSQHRVIVINHATDHVAEDGEPKLGGGEQP